MKNVQYLYLIQNFNMYHVENKSTTINSVLQNEQKMKTVFEHFRKPVVDRTRFK